MDEAATVSVHIQVHRILTLKCIYFCFEFITAYAHLKLYGEALDPLKHLVLYFDTDSMIYVSPTCEHLILVDITGEMGLWTLEAIEDDFCTEFVSCGPKTYALKSKSGRRNIAKSKGFPLHFANQQKFNFDAI